MTPWLLTTPSSRGLGLSLSRRLLRQTTLPLVATTRSDPTHTRDAILEATSHPSANDEADCVQPALSLHSEASPDAEKRLHVLKLDVKEEDTIASAAEQCKALFGDPKSAGGSHLHLGFFVPGILYPEKSPAQLDAAAIRETFDTNIIGPLLLLKHFAPFLPKKSSSSLPLSKDAGDVLDAERATLAVLSARVGSISDNSLGGWYSYRASKAGVNQLAKTFDNYLKTTSRDKATCISLHPGTVKTGLSKDFWGNVKKEKLFSAEYAAECLLDVVMKRGGEGRGKCWDWAGTEVPP